MNAPRPLPPRLTARRRYDIKGKRFSAPPAGRKTNTEGYRSGHNGAVLKTVRVKAHAGSNPAPSATIPEIVEISGIFYFVCHRLCHKFRVFFWKSILVYLVYEDTICYFIHRELTLEPRITISATICSRTSSTSPSDSLVKTVCNKIKLFNRAIDRLNSMKGE